MKVFGKLVLGALSLVPAAFFALFFAWLLPSFFRRSPHQEPSLFAMRFDLIAPIAIGTSALLIILMLFYTVLLARRPDVQVAEKVGVPLGIFFTNGIVLPLVWWLYVWRGSNLAALGRRGG